MIKTVAIIILSVTFFGVLFFILVRNALKRKLDILIEEEKKENQIILINLLNSVFSKSKTLFDNSKLKPPLARMPISFL